MLYPTCFVQPCTLSERLMASILTCCVCPLQVHVGTSHQDQRVVGYLTCTHLHAIEGTFAQELCLIFSWCFYVCIHGCPEPVRACVCARVCPDSQINRQIYILVPTLTVPMTTSSSWLFKASGRCPPNFSPLFNQTCRLAAILVFSFTFSACKNSRFTCTVLQLVQLYSSQLEGASLNQYKPLINSDKCLRKSLCSY